MLSHLVVIILAMGLVAFTLLSFLENYFLQSAEDSLIAQARFTVQTLIPNALTAGPPVMTQSPLNNAIQQQAGNLNLQTTADDNGGLAQLNGFVHRGKYFAAIRHTIGHARAPAQYAGRSARRFGAVRPRTRSAS